MKVKVIVEKQPGEKNCSCFVEEEINSCGLAGYGGTVDEAVADLLTAREDFIALGHDIPELEMEFQYDLWAFIDKFHVNITALAKQMGMNASLMRQYVAGVRKPSKKRMGEIESAIHSYGEQLSRVSLVLD